MRAAARGALGRRAPAVGVVAARDEAQHQREAERDSPSGHRPDRSRRDPACSIPRSEPFTPASETAKVKGKSRTRQRLVSAPHACSRVQRVSYCTERLGTKHAQSAGSSPRPEGMSTGRGAPTPQPLVAGRCARHTGISAPNLRLPLSRLELEPSTSPSSPARRTAVGLPAEQDSDPTSARRRTRFRKSPLSARFGPG